jgi:hypothetical protein
VDVAGYCNSFLIVDRTILYQRVSDVQYHSKRGKQTDETEAMTATWRRAQLEKTFKKQD